MGVTALVTPDSKGLLHVGPVTLPIRLLMTGKVYIHFSVRLSSALFRDELMVKLSKEA